MPKYEEPVVDIISLDEVDTISASSPIVTPEL
jgi:hypothetical protein